MGRKPLKIKRERQLNLSLTVQEHEVLHQRAASAGMRPVDYARARIFLGRSPTLRAAQTHHLDPLLLTQLSRIGNNLNQIARKLHALSLPPSAELEPALQEVRALLRGEGRP